MPQIAHHYVNADGTFAGSFYDWQAEDGTLHAAERPAGLIEVPELPPEADSVWNGSAWQVPSQSPAQALGQKLGLGLAVTSTGTPQINATYALDDLTLTQVGSVARDAASGLGLPGGQASFSYPDATGQPRALTSTNVQALYKAMRDIVWQLQMQYAVLAAGGTPVWPEQKATIS